MQARIIPLWRQPHLMRAFSAVAAAAMAVLLVADALGLGTTTVPPQAAAPMAKIEVPVGAMREQQGAPTSRIEDAAAPLRQDRVAPAADAVAAEGTAGTRAPAGLIAPPAAPVAGLRASEAAAPAPGEAFTASRAASPPAEPTAERAAEASGAGRENGAASTGRDAPTVSARTVRARAEEQAPSAPGLGWPKLAAIALGLIAAALWGASLRRTRRG